MNTQERINELMQSQEFTEAFQAAQTPDEVVALFGSNGIEVPVEIAQELFDASIQNCCELSEEELENVAGGVVWKKALNKVFWYAGYLGGRLAGWDPKRSASYAGKCSIAGSLLGSALDFATGM